MGRHGGLQPDWADGPCQPGATGARGGGARVVPTGVQTGGCEKRGPRLGAVLRRPPPWQPRRAQTRGERVHHDPTGVQAGRRARRRCTPSSHRRAGRLLRGERAQEAPTGAQAGYCEKKKVFTLPPVCRPGACFRATAGGQQDRQQGSTVVWMVASSLLDRHPFVESWRQPFRLLELTHLRDVPTRPSNTV